MGKKYLKKDAVKRVFRSTNYKKQIRPSKKLPDPEFEESDRFLKSEVIFTDRAYKFYKNKTKHTKRFTQRRVFFLIRECLKVLRTRILNNESGVFIEDFGYFCIMRHPERKIRNFYIDGQVFKGKYLHTMGCMYSPIFLPIRKDLSMQQWTMDKAFDEDIIRVLKYRLRRRGKKYRMSFRFLHNLYSRENYKIDSPIRKE